MGAATELSAPAQLGRYRILRHLASGGMADVFLATAMGIEGFERHVVIKRIHPHHAKHPGFVQMFLDEARLAASLHHHNIVQVHDIGQADGEFFYAMEYVHGEDLRQLLHRVSKAKQHVPLDHVIAIVSAAAAGLHHAHELRGPDRKPLGLVHRDVSPSNIIVDYDGNVKVVDFGIAKAAMKTVQTQSGVLKGKVAYMSPEQCRGKAIDRRSDVYALGIVLYELTTARRLFKGENDFMTMSAIVAGKFPPPSSRRKDLPAELEAIIMKALAKEPEDRFQTVQEMRVALDRFASSVGLRSSSTGLAEYMEHVFHGRRIEPWLVEGLLEPEDLTEDFDGSAEGLARVSMSAVAEFVNDVSSAPASSPLLKAQAKVGATSLADAVDESPRLSGAISIPSSEFPAVREPTPSGLHAQTRPSTQPGVRGASAPMPAQWPTAPPPERRGRAWLIAVVAIPLIIGGIVLGPRLLANMTEGETRSGEPAPSIAPEPVTMPAASPTPASTPPLTPSTPPPSSDPAPAPAPEPTRTTAAPVADSAPAAAVPVPTPARANPTPTKPSPTRTGKRPKPAKPTKKTTKPPAKSGSADPDWNPDELLPD